jgi:pyridoxamine 5'-phosphate oxidase
MDERELDADPLRQFERWFGEAAEVVRVPEAVAVATATRDGAPSARMVLLKQFDERGFVFFTNYESRKGGELAANPRTALLFHWDALGRQVRVEGEAGRVAREESEAYFRTRPRGAQIGALASRQSRVLASRDELETRVAELEREYEGRDVPLPESWGGIRVVPDAYEFWEHRDSRLHDRFRYARRGSAWVVERLSP